MLIIPLTFQQHVYFKSSQVLPQFCQIHSSNTVLKTLFHRFPQRHFLKRLVIMNSFILGVFLSSVLVISDAATCTYYGSPTETGVTASGENFNPMALTCSAQPHVPINSVVQVTNQRTGRSITVRVNDRYAAPPAEDSLDLTYGAFGVLANHDDGIFPCSYEIISENSPSSTAATPTHIPDAHGTKAAACCTLK